MTINKQISKRRNKLKITQKELAESAGISLISVKKIEAGDITPSQGTIKKIADVLQCEYVEKLVPIKKQYERKTL